MYICIPKESEHVHVLGPITPLRTEYPIIVKIKFIYDFFQCWPRYHLAEWYDVSERAPRYLLQREGLDPAQRMFELCVPQLEIGACASLPIMLYSAR